jgi:hypothetical protein
MESLDDLLNSANNLYLKGQFLSASTYYRLALENIKNKKIDSDTQNLIKNRLNECIKNLSDQFEQFSTESIFNQEELMVLNQFNEEVLSEINFDLKNFPKSIYLHTNVFIPSFQENKKIATDNLPLAYQIANVAQYTKDGYVSGNNQDNSPLELWSFKTYQMEQPIRSTFHINPLFQKMVDEKIFTSENFNGLIDSLNIEGAINNVSILKKGISHYIIKDYISVIHILIPQLENLILIFAKKNGIQTDIIERGKTITRGMILSDNHLQSSEFIDLLGENYCYFLRYVLYSPLGLKLRHKVAHGTIFEDECNETNCNLILVALFIILHKMNI